MTLRIPALLLMGAILLAPNFASAATKKPSCTLTVTTPSGKTTVRTEKDIAVSSGDSVRVAWDMKNATKVVSGKTEVDESDSETFTVTKSTSRSYTVFAGKKKETCEVSFVVTDASLTTATLSTKDKKLAGTAEGVRELKIYVTKDKKKVYTSKDLKVKNGKWSVTMKKALPAGSYNVEIQGDKLGTLFAGTMTAGSVSSGGSVSASLVPLLMGGTARAGESVPVFYLKLANTGKAPATITGVTMRQAGSAPTAAISNLTIIDEKGGSSGNSGINAFKNGIVRIPTTVVLAPGEMRLFTVRAVLAPTARTYFGTQIALELTGVEGGVSGKFPIRGTSLSIGN